VFISEKKKLIFVHVPRTGGLSIQESLHGCLKCSPLVSEETKHETLCELSSRVAVDVSEYFVFGFVRNPWERVVSSYTHIQDNLSISFDDFVEEMINPRSWVQELHLLKGQKAFFLDGKGVFVAGFVGRFERLGEDLKKVGKMIGVDVELGHLNSSQHGEFREFYTEKTREIVGSVFSEDITFFGYDYEEKS